MPVTTIRVALLGFDGVQGLDLVGPLDAFAAANDIVAGAYGPVVVSLDGRPFVSEAGLRMVPDCALAGLGPVDTLIVPGGAGLRRAAVAAPVVVAIKARAPSLRRILSICTGIYAVGATGLLDGRRATTHWRFALDVAARFPAVTLDPDAIYVKDGPFYTSAGITAAIDLALAVIEEDYGSAVALEVARDLVVYLKRSGGQRQYSTPLRLQTRARDRFATLVAWIPEHLDADLSVDALAARVRLSPRQFTRRFTALFGASPAHQIESLRLEAARDHLSGSRLPIAAIATSVGFAGGDVFRRAFDRRFGLSPSDYRARFWTGPAEEPGETHEEPTKTAVARAAVHGADCHRRPSDGAEIHRRRGIAAT